MQDGRKAVWSIPYVSVVFFPSLKHNFIAYCSSKVSSHSDCIFEIHQLWQSGFNRVYSNCCCSCSFEAEIIKISQSSHKTYSNQILNFQKSRTILIARTKKVWKLIVCTVYMLANSFHAFLSFRALVLVGYFLLHLEAVFTSARFFLTANVSDGTLCLALCLVGMHSAAASKWALMKFSYSSFGVCVSVFSCSASTLFLSFNNIYL